MISLIISITVIYIFLIGSFILGFDRIQLFELTFLKPKTRFSIIIPFRNEAKNLPLLLKSISRLKYPKDYFEIIFVDDDSDDDSVDVLNAILTETGITPTDIKVIKNVNTTNSPKKDAISLAISRAKYDWVVTTDADCTLPIYWLNSFDECIQKQNPDLIAAPVTYHHTKGFLQNFQLLEVLSLQGATIGAFGIKNPFLCNGANLAYKKLLFKMVNGFQGNSEIASGDDVFLLEKATEQKLAKVHYLKCKQTIVTSTALNSTPDLIAQRVRWAAKSSASKSIFGKLTSLVILAQNALIICGLIFTACGILTPTALLFIFMVKLSIDFTLIYKTANFFNQKNHLKHYLLSALYYPFFIVCVVFLAIFKGYKWKGRRYRQ